MFYPTHFSSWCDRVILDKDLMSHLLQDNVKTDVNQYQSFGLDSVVGDHKPVYLLVNLPIQ